MRTSCSSPRPFSSRRTTGLDCESPSPRVPRKQVDVRSTASGDFCGGARAIKHDEKAGRYFRTCVDEALAALPVQLDRLRDPSQGPQAVLKNIKQRQEERETSTTQFEMEQSRRLKGAQLQFVQGVGAKRVSRWEAQRSCSLY